MRGDKLNEEVIKRLPAPSTGNRITYFAGARIQGAQAPRGFGVRVTAAGAKSFVLNYRSGVKERRYTIGSWPDWSALRAVREARSLRQRIDKGQDPQDEKNAEGSLLAELSRFFWTSSYQSMFAARTWHCGVAMPSKARLID
jgi:hypothetical protein